MRNLVLFIGVMCMALSTWAQGNSVRLTLNLIPPYSTSLTDYRPSPSGPGKMIVTIQNLANREQRIYIRAEVRGENNGVRIYTNPDYVPATPVVLAPMETRQLFPAEIMEIYDPNRLVYIGTDQRQIRNSDRVPEGLYSVCIRAYDHTPGRTQFPLSAENPSGCATAYMQDAEPPMLIQPFQHAEVRAFQPQNIIFSWNQPAGAAPDTRYRLRILEMFEGDGRHIDPNVVYESSRSPVFDQEVMGTNYIYGPSDHALVPGRRYAWAVTVVDPAGKTSYRNNGRSEVRAFLFKDFSPAPIAPAAPPPIVKKNSEKEKPAAPVVLSKVTFVRDLEIRNLVLNTFKGKLVWAFRKSETGYVAAPPPTREEVPGSGSRTLGDFAQPRDFAVMEASPGMLDRLTKTGNSAPASGSNKTAAPALSTGNLYAFGGGNTHVELLSNAVVESSFISEMMRRQRHQARILSLADEKRYPLADTKISLYLQKKVGGQSAAPGSNGVEGDLLAGQAMTNAAGEFSITYTDEVPPGYEAFLKIENPYFEFAAYDIPLVKGENGTYDVGELTGLAKTFRMRVKVVNEEGSELDLATVRLERTAGFYNSVSTNGNLVHEVMKDSLSGQPAEVVAVGKSGSFWPRMFYSRSFSDSYSVVIEGEGIRKTVRNVSLIDFGMEDLSESGNVVFLEKSYVADIALPVVEGRVLTRNGEIPAAGAIVTVRKKGSKSGQTTQRADGTFVMMVDLSARSATADSLGRFKVENIPTSPEAAEVVVQYKGKETKHDKDLYLSQRGLKEVIDPLFVNAELVTVVGKVVDVNGEPLPDATLNWKNGGKAFYSDEEGNFTGSQTEGKHTLIARKPGFRDTEYEVDLKVESKQKGSYKPSAAGNLLTGQWAQSVASARAQFTGTGQYAGQAVVPKQSAKKPEQAPEGKAPVLSSNLAASQLVTTTAALNYYNVFSDGLGTESISSGHVVVMSRFYVKAIVKDDATGQPVANAKVSTEGGTAVSLTNTSGTAVVGDVPGGNAALIVSGPEGSFYATRKAEILMEVSKDTLTVEVTLKAGAKAAGQVKQNGNPVAGATVAVEGLEHIFTLADDQGRYTLSGIPVGEYTLIASKEGMLADQKSRQFDAKESYTLDFNLTDPGFNASSLLGFKMVLHRSKPGPGPNEFIISGELKDLPDNPVFKNAGNGALTLRFSDKIIVKDGNTIYPKGGELVTDVSEIRLKAFGYLAVRLKNSTGIRVRPASPGNRTEGEITGEADLDIGATFASLSGITLPSTPVKIKTGNAGNTIAPISSTGSLSLTSFGLSGATEGWSLYDIKLIPDLAGCNVDKDGINLKGKIKIEGVPLLNNQELKLDRLVISKRGEIKDAGISLNPAPVLTLVTWKLKLNRVAINQYGLKLSGDLDVPVPSSETAKIAVKELGINGESLTGGTFLLPSAGIDIFGQVRFKTNPGKDFTIQKIAGSTHYRFIGAGTIDLPKWINQRIKLDHFSVATNGDFSVVAETDIEVDFAGMAKLGITKFGFASNVSQITVGGKFRLNIPMFGAGAEGTMYFRKGQAPRMDELGIYFDLASAIALEAKVKFNETEFRGKGGLKLAGIPGVGLEFWYEKKSAGPRVGAQFLANVVIPIGLVKLDKLTGGFDFDFSANIYSINAGGRITVAPDPYGVVALDPVAVKVTSAPGGPIFEGGATVRVMNSWAIGSATMKLDFNRKQFFIDGEFGAGFSLMKGVNVESRSGVHLELFTGAGNNYWFVAGYSRTNILGIFDTGVTIAAGWNVPKSTHASLAGVPDFVLTNGRLYGGYFGAYSNIDIGSPSINFLGLARATVWYKNTGMSEVYANLKSNAFGLKIASSWNAGGKVTVFKVGDIAHADIGFAGALEGYYNSNAWGLRGSLSGHVRGHIGCDGGCNFITWGGCFNACLVGCEVCPIPCGFKVCAGAAADVSYQSNGGFDVKLRLFE
ncbi:hypothetical protein GCM10023091_03900 [Ravibacter arvi]|uniref:Carboxypeptidase family protein n=1 Tax=Ravibacter arvi TaxID=2051041 RepID=A0ABP8LLV5_9BACT